MSLVCYFVLVKLFINLNELHVIDKSIGWFLFEHVYEEYSVSAGKLFLMNEDFRSLIKNFLLLARNLIFFSFFKTLLEFFFIFLLIALYFFLFFYLLYLLNTKEAERKNLNNLFFVYFYGFLFFIFFRQLFVIFTWYDLSILFNLSIIFLILGFVIIILFTFIKRFFLEKRVFNYVKLLLIKTFFYFFMILSTTFLFLHYRVFIDLPVTNNVIQEMCLNLLFFYTYLYYFFELIYK